MTPAVRPALAVRLALAPVLILALLAGCATGSSGASRVSGPYVGGGAGGTVH
ncbi:hypothetical protein [Rhizosaccharibacter radicis]|uniref:Lipoprotein n=1 Tax=Rhizosaccharibacter radicis TaxID=2782605 RepID=A0ABT1VUB5_9PROT|nr:hypothetical protein [Acetobacteraceae bacterium KSS12]